MTQPIAEAVREVLSQGRPDEAAAIIQRLEPGAAVGVFTALSFEEQQILFFRLPVDFAAALVSHFPYYHEYVLLHSRPAAEMRAIVDKLDPTERIRFFDELPEEAWQRLMDELAAAPAEAPGVAPPPGVVPAPPPPAVEKIIEARHVEKSFQQPDGREIQVIAPLDLCVESNAIIALLGSSGCGKSTLLRILSGLATPSGGAVLWHGRPLSECPPNVAIVFQSFASFPWLTVLENVEAPLLARGMPHLPRHRRALHALNSVGLKGSRSKRLRRLGRASWICCAGRVFCPWSSRNR